MTNNSAPPYMEFRADGWPLCPQCGDDELYSLLYWNGLTERPPLREWIDAGMKCYLCGWESRFVNENRQDR